MIYQAAIDENFPVAAPPLMPRACGAQHAPWPVKFIGPILVPLMLAGYTLLIGYVNGDARRRGMRYVMWTLLAIFLANGIGIILYFILREPLLVYCPRCGAGVQPGHAFCPRCGAGLPLMPPHRADWLDALRLVRKSVVGMKSQSERRPGCPVAQALVPAASRLIGTPAGHAPKRVPMSRDAAD